MNDLLDRRDFIIAPGLMETKVQDELILLHPGREEYFGLNFLGAAVFQAARSKENLRDLAVRVAKEDNVSLERVENDFRDLLQDLLDGEILSIP